VVTQFLGHIARGEPINLVDGGEQKRAFTYIDDGIDALTRIIENKNDIANGKIYNIGNPLNNHSVKELAHLMMAIAQRIPEYQESAKHVVIQETTSTQYYGKGYQDVQNRVPKIENTMQELGWKPTTTMDQALENIFEAYRFDVVKARKLVDH
jgi:nucleoside-diphosphate-sugar epimerase